MTCKHLCRNRCSNPDCPAMEHSCPVAVFPPDMCRYFEAVHEYKSAEFTEVINCSITRISKAYGDIDAYEKALHDQDASKWLRIVIGADDVLVTDRKIFRKDE